VVLYEYRKVTEFYTLHATDQCHRYLLFRYHYATCNSHRGPTCALCSGPHSTDNHTYVDCPTRSGHTYHDTTYKCANCAEAGHTDTLHTTYNSHCLVKATIVYAAWQKMRATPPPDSIPAETNLINDTTMTADE
jgi:hypothetical protein